MADAKTAHGAPASIRSRSSAGRAKLRIDRQASVLLESAPPAAGKRFSGFPPPAA
ncbi:hypothetical protein LNO81_17125 [Klebsiella variicola subsp. variicola]|nr:hypothetical protein [Klebsiella variicola subsp. variicola]